MGFSVPAAISNSILPSCIPSLLSNCDVIAAEGYSVSYSSKRVTGGKEPGRALFVEVMLPSENVPSRRGRRRDGEVEKHTTREADADRWAVNKITVGFRYTGILKCTHTHHQEF